MSKKRKRGSAVVEVEGDLLLYAKADYIVQQCNCLTVRGLGLYTAIAAKFPDAHPYSGRREIGQSNCAVEEDRAEPGSIAILGRVICLFAQWRPGSCSKRRFDKYPDSPSGPETIDQRIAWFRQALNALAVRFGDTLRLTIAFPHGIGCGLGGGRWDVYRSLIVEFANAHKNFRIVIAKK